MKKGLFGLVILVLIASLAVFMVACGNDGTVTVTPSEGDPATQSPSAGENTGTQTPAADPEPVAITKDAFFAELDKRESDTRADPARQYVMAEGRYFHQEAERDDIDEVGFGSFKYTDSAVAVTMYISAKGMSLYENLFCSDILKRRVEEFPDKAEFFQDGEELIFTIVDAINTYGERVYYKMILNAEGYEIYRKEAYYNGDDFIENTEFTLLSFAKEVEEDAFLEWILNRGFDITYASAEVTVLKNGAGDIDGTHTGTFAITYDDPERENRTANLTVLENGSTVEVVTVLGYHRKLVRFLENSSFKSATFASDGSKRYVTMTFNGGMNVQYIFDKDGYLLYSYERQTASFWTEIKVAKYNRAA